MNEDKRFVAMFTCDGEIGIIDTYTTDAYYSISSIVDLLNDQTKIIGKQAKKLAQLERWDLGVKDNE